MTDLEIFLDKHKDLNIIFLTKYGSHLFGMSTAESDSDFKGVFLPTIRECILNEIPRPITNQKKDRRAERPKNTSKDTDITLYSLQDFLKMAYDGDTGALDMLHSPIGDSNIVLRTTPIWQFLHENRADFYTKNLSAFVGYCKRQAAKYGNKGSRLNDAKRVVDFLMPMLLHNPGLKLSECWDRLPEGENIRKIPWEELHAGNLQAAKLKTASTNRFPYYQVCEKNLQSSVNIAHAYECLARFCHAYGNRAKLAAANEGNDWKALSHALRAAYEVEAIYAKGDITFPLPNANYLLEVKQGKRDYRTDVAPMLEYIIEHVERLVEKSIYPETVNIKKYETWLQKIYNSQDKASSPSNPVTTYSGGCFCQRAFLGMENRT